MLVILAEKSARVYFNKFLGMLWHDLIQQHRCSLSLDYQSFKSAEVIARQEVRSGTFTYGTIFKLSVWLITERRLTVKVTVGLSILTFERCSDLGYLGLRLCSKYISNWNALLTSVLRNEYKVLSHCNHKGNINDERLFYSVTPLQWTNTKLIVPGELPQKIFKKNVKLTSNSSLVMNDNTTKPLSPGLQDSRGRLKQRYCKLPLIR